MKKLIALTLTILSLNAIALGDQEIINPLTGKGIWVLSQLDCNNDSSKGVIFSGGKPLGCWWTNLTPENKMADQVWFLVNGQVYTFPTTKLKRDMEQYRAAYDLPWQTMQEINNAYRTTRPAYNPPITTQYYGAGGGYLGNSVSQ